MSDTSRMSFGRACAPPPLRAKATLTLLLARTENRGAVLVVVVVSPLKIAEALHPCCSSLGLEIKG